MVSAPTERVGITSRVGTRVYVGTIRVAVSVGGGGSAVNDGVNEGIGVTRGVASGHSGVTVKSRSGGRVGVGAGPGSQPASMLRQTTSPIRTARQRGGRQCDSNPT